MDLDRVREILLTLACLLLLTVAVYYGKHMILDSGKASKQKTAGPQTKRHRNEFSDGAPESAQNNKSATQLQAYNRMLNVQIGLATATLAKAWLDPKVPLPREMQAFLDNPDDRTNPEELLRSGREFLGQKRTEQGSVGGEVFVLRLTHFEPSSRKFTGTMSWPELHSVHVIKGWLYDWELLFREVKWLRRGKAPLGYTYHLHFNASTNTFEGEAAIDFNRNAAEAKEEAQLLPLDPDQDNLAFDTDQEHPWPPVEEPSWDGVKEHNPFGPGPGKVELTLLPIQAGAGSALVTAMDETLATRLASGKPFRGITAMGIFRFRMVRFNRASGQFEGRIQWTRSFNDLNALQSLAFGSMSPVQDLGTGRTHKVLGKLTGRTLVFVEDFAHPAFTCGYYGLVFDGDHTLSGRVFVENTKVPGMRVLHTHPVEMDISP